MNESTHFNNAQLPATERSQKRIGDVKSGPAAKRPVDECHEMLDRLDSDQVETIRALMELFLRPRK